MEREIKIERRERASGGGIERRAEPWESGLCGMEGAEKYSMNI